MAVGAPPTVASVASSAERGTTADGSEARPAEAVSDTGRGFAGHLFALTW